MAIIGTYTENGMIIRASDGACVPPDPGNRDYQEILAAIAPNDENNNPDPNNPRVPDEVAAYVAPAPDPNYTIPKQLPFIRATDEEAATMEQLLNTTSARLRMIYNGATFISTDDPLFGLLMTMMTGAFGADRAAELLAKP